MHCARTVCCCQELCRMHGMHHGRLQLLTNAGATAATTAVPAGYGLC
jgi:hypothetical protein